MGILQAALTPRDLPGENPTSSSYWEEQEAASSPRHLLSNCMVLAANLGGISRVPGRTEVVRAGLPGPAAASSQGHCSLRCPSQPLPTRQCTGKHGGASGQQDLTVRCPQTPPTPIRVMLHAPARQQCPVVVPAGKVLDPGVGVGVG